MGKWRRYRVGPYRLGQLHGQAVATWLEAGKRHRYRLAVRTEAEGRAALDQFARNRQALAARSSTTLKDLWTAYIADRALDGKNVENMRQHWKALGPRFGLLSPSSIDADICRDYAKRRLETVSQGTVWTELTQLRSALNWAAKRKIIAEAPYVWVPAKPAPKQRVLTASEGIALLEAAGAPHVRTFIVLALATAARSGAILGLTWDRVDFIAGTVDFRLSDTPNPLQKVSRKGRAIVPMNDWLRAELQDARKAALTDHAIEWNAEPVACIRNAFQKAVGRASLDGVTPHTLRHSAASWLLWSGADMERISRYLAHKDRRTTETIYAKSSSDYLRPAADVLQLPAARKKG